MSNPKELRKQLRNVVQEILPEILTKEVISVIQAELNKKILEIETSTKKTMHEMNERHKDTMGYLVRSVTTVKKPD